mgnify:CR=1 FL=1
MIAETTAYKLLSNDDKLNELFDSYRGGKFGHGLNKEFSLMIFPKNQPI